MTFSPIERLVELHPKANKPDEPYIGVAALFNGDLHAGIPDYAQREDWLVLSPYEIKHVPVEEDK